jgi:N-acyl-D-aspartate/D-glutamate deacylase
MPTPLTIEFDLHNPAISLSNMASWKPLFGQDVATQTRSYGDPAFRAATRRDMLDWGMSWPWDRTEIRKVGSPALAHLEGRVVADLAAERGQDPLDTFLDIPLEDELRTRYAVRLFNVDPERVGALITDPRTLIGLSDAGAHIDVFCTADYCTNLLGAWVRDMRVMSLEHAVKRITSEPADYFGITDRGRLRVGLAADIVIFDEHTIDSLQRTEMIYDFPAGLGRLVTRARGIDYTIVNGQVLYEQGQRHTGALPGRVVRPGRAADPD